MTADFFAGFGFVGIFAAAVHRIMARGWKLAEFRHIPIVGAFCAIGAIGCFARVAYPEAAWLPAAALVGVGLTMLIAAPILNRQPSRDEVAALTALLAEIDERIARLETRQVYLTGHYGHRHGASPDAH